MEPHCAPRELPRPAAIYVRVSDAKQKTRGDGLRSQETRCREYARFKGHEVAAVFQDDISGGVGERPGFSALLAFLRKHKAHRPVVVIDDISRFARDTVTHWKLRETVALAGGFLESPSIEFGETSDAILQENILAAMAQHQRQKNAEQTKNRMRARLMNGFWVFQAPIGYRYERKPGQGKTLVRDEPHASHIEEALLGFASGRFRSQVEVKRFLESCPFYPKDKRTGEIRQQRIAELLRNPLYAGLVERPNWNVTLRSGQHEGLISVTVFQRIQERLERPVHLSDRKDRSDDFPLRGAVQCADCGNPLTACWSKGKSSRYPYYLCPRKGCPSYRKSIPRDLLETRFAALLENSTPSKELHKLAKAFLKDLWNQKEKREELTRQQAKARLKEHEEQIATLLDRIIETNTPAVIARYEEKIAKLEREKLACLESLQSEEKHGTFEDLFEHALEFLANPLRLWLSDNLADKRMVLKLTFASHLSYCRAEGFRTPDLSLPFSTLRDFSTSKNMMAHLGERKSNTFFDSLSVWKELLQTQTRGSPRLTR